MLDGEDFVDATQGEDIVVSNEMEMELVAETAGRGN
jgi:endo-1,4-beta-mannosidase